MCLFCVVPISGITQYVCFCDWLLSLHVMFSRFIHMVMCYQARQTSGIWRVRFHLNKASGNLLAGGGPCLQCVETQHLWSTVKQGGPGFTWQPTAPFALRQPGAVHVLSCKPPETFPTWVYLSLPINCKLLGSGKPDNSPLRSLLAHFVPNRNLIPGGRR